MDLGIVCTGTRLIVRYLPVGGQYPALEYHLREAGAADQGRFQALAQRLADHGVLPSSTHGHFLKPPYREIFEIKPKSSRYFGFFYERVFYIAHAASKKPGKVQRNDYKIAATRRKEFIERMEELKGGK